MFASLLLGVALTVIPGNNMPLVEASVDGEACTLLVDTGASHTTLDLNFVTNRLSKVELQEVQLMGLTNVRMAPKYAAISELKVGSAIFEGGLMAIDLKHLSKGVGRKVDGILGINHLRIKPCVISLKRGELIFDPSEAELAGFHKVLTRDRGNTFELIVKLPSGRIEPMLVDTGSSFTFINRELWPEAKETVSMATTDVNEKADSAFVKGEKGELNCGKGYKLTVEPMLTPETNRNQLGADLFKRVDIYLAPNTLKLR